MDIEKMAVRDRLKARRLAPEMGEERRLLLAMALEAAGDGDQKLQTWCELHGLNRATLYHTSKPNLDTVYKVCEACGVKVSEFFVKMGR